VKNHTKERELVSQLRSQLRSQKPTLTRKALA